MISYSFQYHRPKTVAEAAAMFSQMPDAKFLAGGQTLIPAMKQRLAQPAALIDIGGLKELSFIRAGADAIAVGAGTKHGDIATSQDVSRAIPALADLAATIGDPAVRSMGTLGGSVANADPAADYPAAVLALGAAIKTNRRSIAADEFFTGLFSTALEDGELVTEVSFPVPERAGYAKFRNPASRYAMPGAFVAKMKNGVRVAVTGAASCVFRVKEMETALAEKFTPGALAGISISPEDLSSDLHASAEYRAHLVSVMAKHAVEKANAK